MTVRRWIARKLCPEMARSADLWERAYHVEYHVARRWLGEFSIACAALDWVFKGAHDYWRPLGAPAANPHPADITAFRDSLRHSRGRAGEP